MQLLEASDLIHSEEVVNQAIVQMAIRINNDYVNKQPMILCVMTGGLYFTGQILPKLNFVLDLDYVQVTRYSSSVMGNHLKWLVPPKDIIKNRNILIIDDILDAGVTLQAIVKECRLLGAEQVKTAVLIEKELNITKPINADYVGLKVPSRYVFGCGMDINGWWRNLPAIYALRT